MKSVVNHKFILAILIIFAFLIYAPLFWLTQYGIDFSDEGFYLAWIANPKLYDYITPTRFGFLYHLIFNLVGQNIVLLRAVSMLMLLILLFIFSFYFLKYFLFKQDQQSNSFLLFASALAFSTTIVGYYCAFLGFLPTPSYNSLNFKGILVAHIGLLLLKSKNINATIKTNTAPIIIGLGLWLTFMAKPTSTFLLGVGVVLYLFITRQQRYWFLIITTSLVCIALIFATAFYIDGSLHKFFMRYVVSWSSVEVLTGGSNLYKLFKRHIPYLRLPDFVCIVFVVSLGLVCLIKRNDKTNTLLTLLLLTFSLSILIAFYTNQFVYGLGTSYLRGTISLGIVLSLLIAFLLHQKSFLSIKQLKEYTQSEDFVYGALLFLSPYIYAIGTGRNYWSQMGAVYVFWLCSIILFTKNYLLNNKIIFFRFLILTEALSVFLLNEGLAYPYRQNQPVKKHDYKVSIGPNNETKLIVSQEFGEYIETAKRHAYLAGFKAGTPILDLAGRLPTLIFSIGGVNIGQAWIIGGYPGSNEIAKSALNYVDCKDLSTMWLLVEENGKRAISTDVIKVLGVDIEKHYVMVAKWEGIIGSEGERLSQSRYLKLYKPISPETILNNCVKIRNK